jgi:hypothetical protein
MEASALHRLGSARHRPFGTSRNSSVILDRAKRSEGPKVNNCFEAKIFLCFSPVIWFLLVYHGNKQASNKWRTINRDSRYSNLYDSVDNYCHDISRKDNAWEEISAVIECPVKDQFIISINGELSAVLHRLMKRHWLWVSGTDKLWSSARMFAWSELGCIVPSRVVPCRAGVYLAESGCTVPSRAEPIRSDPIRSSALPA